jgi:diguanylate cyclase (GGDEF)-like protein
VFPLDSAIFGASSIGDLPTWSLLAVSVLGGALVAGAVYLAFVLVTRSRNTERGGNDLVTGVGDRREVIHELENCWERWHETGESFGLIVVDVDAFADINALHGRSAGDRVLSEVAQRIILRVRLDDFVGRVDADEFAVICARIDEDALQDIRTNLEAFVSHSQSLDVTLSIGVAMPDYSDTSALDMLVRARESMRESRSTRSTLAVERGIDSLIS